MTTKDAGMIIIAVFISGLIGYQLSYLIYPDPEPVEVIKIVEVPSLTAPFDMDGEGCWIADYPDFEYSVSDQRTVFKISCPPGLMMRYFPAVEPENQ